MTTTKWDIDSAHSTIQFSVRHMMIAKVHGTFAKSSGTLQYDAQDLSKSRIEVEIDAASIGTGEPKRDEHLRSPDFFDVAKFPHLTFASKKVSAGKVVGDLTLHGVTREVVLDVDGPTGEMKDPYGRIKIGVSATTKIKRSEFGLSWNAALEAGGVLVGDDVAITLEIQFVKAA